MTKYSWAINKEKLQRAIEKVNHEQQPADRRDARIKERKLKEESKQTS